MQKFALFVVIVHRFVCFIALCLGLTFSAGNGEHAGLSIESQYFLDTRTECTNLCSIDNGIAFGVSIVHFVDVIWVSAFAVWIRQT